MRPTRSIRDFVRRVRLARELLREYEAESEPHDYCASMEAILAYAEAAGLSDAARTKEGASAWRDAVQRKANSYPSSSQVST